jgi:hypothetical protein
VADNRLSEDNTYMNEEQPTKEESPVEAQATETPNTESKPREPGPQDLARRLRELLAIPERERSDPIWDEIIGLEIQLAPGNRASAPQGDMGRSQEHGRRQDGGRRPEQQRRPDQAPGGAKPGKRFFKKSRRGSGAPPGGKR